MIRVTLAPVVCLAALPLLLAADPGPAAWTRFRGPNGSGVSGQGSLPERFGPGVNELWRRAVPPGASSPVLTADRLFLTAYEGDRLLTIAIERDGGRILWRRELRSPRNERKHTLNNAASSTPVTDGENVYAFFGDFGLVSYGPDGGERWRKQLGPFQNLHGMASSPMIVGDNLIMVCDQDVDSYLTAIDKDTGETVWTTPRPEAVHGYTTPTVFEPSGDVAQLIVPSSYQLTSYAVEDGRRLWWVRGITWQVKTSTVVDRDTVYLTGWAPGADAGSRRFFPPFEEVAAIGDANKDGKLSPEEIPEEMRHTGSWQAIDLDADGFMNARDWGFYRARWSSRNVTLAVRPQAGRGDLTDTHVVWEYERGVPVVSSPLLYEGAIYTIKDGGILTVFEAKTGEVRSQGRLREALDKYYASPVAGDGKVYFFSETGKATVLSAASGQPLVTNDIGEPCYSTPALADGVLYLRTAEHLYAFQEP